MDLTAPQPLERHLQRLISFFLVLVSAAYLFLSYWDYSKEYYASPTEWAALLHGVGPAPAQYRLGVLFPAGRLAALSHGHLAVRHTVTFLDAIFLFVGVSVIVFLMRRTLFYRASPFVTRCLLELSTVSLFLYYLSWTFWYHKPETIANFALLSLAALLVSGRLRVPPALLAVGLLVLSLYLATIRADSALALNFGLFVIALLPEGKVLPLGRMLQLATAVVGAAGVLGVEFYIKHVLYPHNSFSDGLFMLPYNLRSPIDMFCMFCGLAPYMLIVWQARKHWSSLEAWERAMLVASVVEFVLYLIVAKVNEVRLFMPYPMMLLPLSGVIITRSLLGDGRHGAAAYPETGSRAAVS
jgi:hypothetical protein